MLYTFAYSPSHCKCRVRFILLPSSRFFAPDLFDVLIRYSLHAVEKLLVPIGMEVEAALTRERIEDAVGGKSTALVSDTFPAPNAWIPGGYGRFHAKLAALVNDAAPKVDHSMTNE